MTIGQPETDATSRIITTWQGGIPIGCDRSDWYAITPVGPDGSPAVVRVDSGLIDFEECAIVSMRLDEECNLNELKQAVAGMFAGFDLNIDLESETSIDEQLGMEFSRYMESVN